MLSALLNLGYQKTVAERVIGSAVKDGGELSVELILRRSLRLLSPRVSSNTSDESCMKDLHSMVKPGKRATKASGSPRKRGDTKSTPQSTASKGNSADALSSQRVEVVSMRNAEPADDRLLELSLRPKRLAEYIGQSHVKENLRIFMQAALNRKEALDHVLLTGPQV